MKKKSPAFLDPRVEDLQEMAKKLSMIPKEEQMYIKGRMDAYNDMRNRQPPDDQQAS